MIIRNNKLITSPQNESIWRNPKEGGSGLTRRWSQNSRECTNGNPNKFTRIIQQSIFSPISKKFVLLFVLIVAISMFNFVDDQRRLQFLDSSMGTDDSPWNGLMRNGAANSATGKLFDNKKFRSFHGQRYVKNSKHFNSVERLSEDCKRWGVVTTIFDPGDAINRVANLPSWCLVIVPDTKTPKDYMDQFNLSQKLKGKITKNVYYFDLEQQEEWEHKKGPLGEFVRSTPWGHFCRKNIGYLFAILHGAEYVFDFDDDNFIKIDFERDDPLEILPEGDELVLTNVNVIMQGPNAFNHHPIMGASVKESWARGFPIELIRDQTTRGKVAYNTDLPLESSNGNEREIGVIQFLADGNPDIDAVHRMSKDLPMTFPLGGAPSVLVPAHAYAPYNAQATIHTRKAMFAMLLPGTVPGRVSDIWRGYFAQCIFADAGLGLVFSPPKVIQKRNDHNYLGDFTAEQDLYTKSGKLIEFLSQWDSEHDSIPQRMEQLWIDLYERGYIEVEDVYAVQMWLGALHQTGYEFPPLKRRFRNVAVMGQFNYADGPTTVDDVIFWTQKNRERFDTVTAAGPFTEQQMELFKANSIDAIANAVGDKGYYTPLENHMNTLIRFRDSEKIKGVIYVHDDGIMNITELSEGQYPFPDEQIMGSGDGWSWTDIRHAPGVLKTSKGKFSLNHFAYRIFPDGHLENFDKTAKFPDIGTLYRDLPLIQWFHTLAEYGGKGQTRLAMDPASQPYREKDGSILFSPYAQSDFLFMPTKYADEFANAAQLHLKHGIWIESAYSTVVDMVRRKTGGKSHTVNLCTHWERRGTESAMAECINSEKNYGFIHPYKLSNAGFRKWSETYDLMQ